MSISYSAFLLLLSPSFPPIKYQLRSVLQSPLVFVKVSKAQNCLTEAWPLSDGKPDDDDDDDDGDDDDDDDDDDDSGRKTHLHIEIHTKIMSAKLIRMSSTHLC